MKNLSSPTSVCRRCHHYEPEGRRGGHCQQLNVAVQGAWTACALAIPLFSPAWESFEDIMVWQQKTLAAMQASAESAMTEVLSEAARAETSTSHEGVAMSSADEAMASSLNGASLSPVAEPLPKVPVQTVGLKALWM